jgi:hypothetical protein
MDGKRMPDEALSQALKLESMKATDGPPAKLNVVRVGMPNHRHQGPTAEGLHNPYAGNVRASAIGGEIADRDTPRRTAREQVNQGHRNDQKTHRRVWCHPSHLLVKHSTF